MYVLLRGPRRLSDLGVTLPEIRDLKQKFEIAILDDEAFRPATPLRAHGFRLTELGGDIKSVDQIAAYPIVVCDIRGVGRAFGSKHEGAHVISEIRKTYPDKFLIAYTGAAHDASYNEELLAADKSAQKDAAIEYWVQLLELGLRSIGDPRQRWIRFRGTLLDRGIDMFDAFKLEQAFIASIDRRNSALLTEEANRLRSKDDIKNLVIKFSVYALAQMVENIIKHHK